MSKKTALLPLDIKTAEAGIEIFRLGGNAFDAAVAILASFVTESALTSAAGGGFLLAHTKTNHNTLFDFFSNSASERTKGSSTSILINFGDAAQEFHIGLGSMAVPGNGGVFKFTKTRQTAL